MKKFLLFLMTTVSVFLYTACTPSTNTDQATASIKSSTFSKETNNVLSIFDGKLYFFDTTWKDTAKYFKFTGWTYQDGAWVESGSTSGTSEDFPKQIALLLEEDAYTLYTLIDKDGSGGATVNLNHAIFETASMTGVQKIEQNTQIPYDQETPIFVKIGTTQDNMKQFSITDDFRTLDCDMGFALTLTISDKEL